ncbi:hypothetical protein BDZ89DRAFT_1049338 [Hymenopellis radicata]|nr:hypothetical protein BDZ89DRAFT_1049338 [Hymenopellis radicata]
MSPNPPQLNLLPALHRIRDYLHTLFLNDRIAIPHTDHLARFQLETIHPLSPASGDDLAIQIVCTPPYFPPVTGKSRPCSMTPTPPEFAIVPYRRIQNLPPGPTVHFHPGGS